MNGYNPAQEAEQAVLGSLIYRNDLFGLVRLILNPASFLSYAHTAIYEAIEILIDGEQPADEVTIGDKLKEKGQLQKCGGYAYLAILVDCVPSSGDVEHYAKIVVEHATRRNILKVIGSIQSEYAQNHNLEVQGMISKLSECIDKGQQETKPRNAVLTVKEIIPAVAKRMELIADGKMEGGLEIGFPALDEKLGGIKEQDLVIIGARPSMGKTSFMVNIGRYITKQGKIFLLFSLESSRESIVGERLLPSEARINTMKIAKPNNLEPEEWGKIAFATGNLSTNHFKICDAGGLTTREIEAIIKTEMEKGEIAAVGIDYIQKIKPEKKQFSRTLELEQISGDLKNINKKYNVPIIALSQLNRECEKHNRKPTISDLKDGGQEQDADVVMLLHEDEDNADITNIIIDKNRNGMCGQVPLKFIKKYTRFENLSTNKY
jgi:replicative DNA helicase